jgi:phosphatidylserine/phosphatidylglycerophosphate/cardiolipin synthase-like enzyme
VIRDERIAGQQAAGMSTSVTGQVVLDTASGNSGTQASVSGLQVVVRDDSALFSGVVGKGTTDSDGNYSVSISADPLAGELAGLGTSARKLGIYIYPAKGPRQLSYVSVNDTADATLQADPVTLRSADISGWAVSLPGTTNALPIRSGNAVRLLVDDQAAWSHVATAMKGAQQSISVMQLELDLPHAYNSDQQAELPEIILAFPESFDPDQPTALTGAIDNRPERLLLSAAQSGKQVRVMISHSKISVLTAVADFVLLLVPFVIGSLIGFRPAWAAWSALFQALFGGGPKGDAGALSNYFSNAGSSAQAVPFNTRMFSVIHAKAVLIDTVSGAIGNAEGILLGSPFTASYWDTGNHTVYEPRRGSCAGEPIPVHDVSIGIRGPAVADLQQQFLGYWNIASPASQVVALDPAPDAVTAATDEYPASVQLARTVDNSTLPNLDSGELGVLEAYLRAIENATEYIYIENQYFTNETIGAAISAALKDSSRPNLQVILMVNVVPDMPFYPTWQTNLFARIRRDAGAGASRFGVFTAWSHTGPAPAHKHTNPVIMPDYLHTKSAVVDGSWATIGSANLDGASLDQFQILHALQFGSFRNGELNYVMYSGVEDLDQTVVVDQLRLQLWSEHLGMDTTDPRLSKDTLSASNGWLQLWTDAATAKLQGLIDDPTVISPSRVLAYPQSATSGFGLLWAWSHPHKNFLQTSTIGGASIDLSKLDLVEHTTAFNYQTGQWADH